MSFEPASNRHAIGKVIFALRVEPGFAHEEIDAIKSANSSWKNLLPALDRIELFGFQIRPENQQQSSPPPVPDSFTRYKPDGNLELTACR